MLAPGGVSVPIGMPENGVTAAFGPVALKLDGSDLEHDIPALINFYRRGQLKLSKLITDQFSFEMINPAMASARQRVGVGIIIQFDSRELSGQ